MRWLDRLSADDDNLRAALAWSLESGKRADGIQMAAALHLFWTLRPHFPEGYRWWSQLLAGPQELGPALAATAYSHAAWYA